MKQLNFSFLLPFTILTSLILLSIPTQLTLHYFNSSKSLSPESSVLSASSPNPSTLAPNPYVVLGFLPYWLLNQSEHIQYPQLTQIAYFGVEFDSTANLKTWEDGGRELGLHRLSQPALSQVIVSSHQARVSPILVVKILNNPGITAATDPANRSQVIADILQLMENYKFTGINIDFEYIGSPPPEIQRNFTEFVKQLRQQLKPSTLAPNPYTLSLDVYADTASKQTQRLWQIADLAPHLDHIVIMGYDFFRSTSPAAGPVAPLRGSPQLWEDDLTTNLREFTKLVPPSKLILGVPFYGYEWTTYTNQPGSVAIPRTGRLATYSRVHQLLLDCTPQLDTFGEIIRKLPGTYLTNCQSGFHPQALSPYLIYHQDDQINQVWYEDSRSLKYKLQLITQSGLAGIAIWALGYESPHPDLWQTIDQEFR